MNIFVTDNCPIKSAKFLDDKRVVKMCLESAQMLSSAVYRHVGKVMPPLYKPTHVHHPCTIWAGDTQANYLWLHDHFVALCAEYTRRYTRHHKCSQLIAPLFKAAEFIPYGELTPFANCARNQSVGVDYTDVDPVTVAYQLYLNDRWDLDKREPTWT